MIAPFPSNDELTRQIETLRREGQFSQAAQVARQVIQQLRQAGQSGPPLVTALTTLAEVLAAAGQSDDARRLLLQAGQMVPSGEAMPPAEAGRIAYNLGLLFLAQANFDQAEKHLTTALTQRQTALGANDPTLAPILNGLGQLQLAQGNYDPAQTYFEQALALSPPEQALSRADSLTGLAQVQQSRGIYLQAKTHFAAGLALQQANLGPQHPAIAKNLMALAGLDVELGDYTYAEARYQTALTINQQSLGQQHPATAATLEQLARLYQIKGEFEPAENFYKQALAVQRARVGEKHPDFGRGLANLADLYHQRGNLDQARQLLLLALDTAQKAAQPLIADIKNALGQLYRTLGDYDLAGQELDQALAMQQASLGQTHIDLAPTRHHRAGLALDRGDYRQAAAEEKTALDLRLKGLGPAHPAVADSQQSLADLYHRIGDETRARQLLTNALTTRQTALGERHLKVADTLHLLAEVEVALGDSAAEANYRQALDIRREKLGPDHLEVARSLASLAQLLQAEGQIADAEARLLAAIKIWQAKVGRTHPDFAAGLYDLARLYQTKGNAEEANAFYRWALQISGQALGKQHPAVARTLTDWATLEAAGGRLDPALAKFKEAATIDRQMIGQVFSLASERQRLGYLRHLTRLYNLFLSLVSRHLTGRPEAITAACDLVLQRKGLSAEALAVQRDEILQGHYPALQADLRRLTALREQIAQQTLAGPGEEAVEIYQARLNKWVEEKETLEAELATKIPEMDLAQKLRQADRSAVAAALPKNSALVEFVRFERFDLAAIAAPTEPEQRTFGYLAFVILAGRPEALRLVDLGDAGEIDALIGDFRTTITGEVERRGATVMLQREAVETRLARRRQPAEAAGAVQPNPGRQLRERLLDPLDLPFDQLARLLIAPDGDLARLPFEILPLGDGPNERLIHKLPVSYVSVGRDVLRFGQASAQKPHQPLVIADPDFDLVAPEGAGQASTVAVSIHFGRLAGTRLEGEMVGRLLQVEPLLAEAALKQRVKAQPSPRVLHLASHGFFLTPQPGRATADRDLLSRLADQVENPLLRSGLALAGINSWNKGLPLPAAAENGILTGEDVSGLDLTATELVVLSACETGLGAVEVGEGVFGLRRAFMLAGAKSLVMSLWEVPDKQTQQLMADFYANLAQGEAPAIALRQAQLKLAEAQPNPFYWGAFICQGEVA